MGCSENSQLKIVNGDAGYVLEDVPHLTDYIPDLPVYLSLSLSLSL
jgi:6-phosphofructokinase 1